MPKILCPRLGDHFCVCPTFYWQLQVVTSTTSDMPDMRTRRPNANRGTQANGELGRNRWTPIENTLSPSPSFSSTDGVFSVVVSWKWWAGHKRDEVETCDGNDGKCKRRGRK